MMGGAIILSVAIKLENKHLMNSDNKSLILGIRPAAACKHVKRFRIELGEHNLTSASY